MSQPNPIQIQKYLSGVDYPLNKDQLPEREYDGANALSAEVSGA